MYLLAYDVETANAKNIGSICAVGWVLLDNDVIADQGYSLINPRCAFSKATQAVHGITEKDVEHAPTFAEYWSSTLGPLMEKAVVLAHSAAFDTSATEQALYNASVPDPGIVYMDTLPLARIFLDCASYKLCDLAALAGYTYQAHHAGEDALALVRVLEYLRDMAGLEDIASVLLRSGIPLMNTRTNNFMPRKVVMPETRPFTKYTHCTDDVAQVDSCFASRRFCITGDIPGYERADVEKIIMEHGGKPTGGVSGKTDYLIVGEYDAYGPGYVSGKQKKALELQEQGCNIKIIRPEEFFAMIAEEQKP